MYTFISNHTQNRAQSPRNARETEASWRGIVCTINTNSKKRNNQIKNFRIHPTNPSLLCLSNTKRLIQMLFILITITCLCTSSQILAGPTGTMSHPTVSNIRPDTEMEDAVPVSNKRNTPEKDHTTLKKSKSSYTPFPLHKDNTINELWLGFPNMERIAYEASIPPRSINKTVEELTHLGVQTLRGTGTSHSKGFIPTRRAKAVADLPP